MNKTKAVQYSNEWKNVQKEASNKKKVRRKEEKKVLMICKKEIIIHLQLSEETISSEIK